MKKKILTYIVLLLIIPIIISIILGFVQEKEEKNIENNYKYNGLDLPEYKDTTIDEIKRSDTYIYITIFGLLFVSSGVWLYIKKKEDF